ncbi:MAG: deaminase [Paracraurococcus sp.]
MAKHRSMPKPQPGRVEALALARAAQGPDLVIGVVGAVGSGTSTVARVLRRLLGRAGADSVAIRASDVLARAAPLDWAAAMAEPPMRRFGGLQAIGSRLRHENDNAFVAAGMIAGIDAARAGGGPPIAVCDAIRHPAEVQLLRSVYGEAFWLVGVVCDERTRHARLMRKYGLAPEDADAARAVQDFMGRDENAGVEHGQKVAEAFRYADFHCDSSAALPQADAPDAVLDAWPVTADLERFLSLVRADRPMLRPTEAEQAMYHAYAARLGSACLSRQVGAVLLGQDGQLLATGCNEVPRAGGGLYGEGMDDPAEVERGRCHAYGGFCRNTDERNKLVDHVLDLLAEEGVALGDETARTALARRLRRSRLGHLVEFSRSVHAEMDALVSAARRGVSTVGARLFVTTFPCHNCARHIVAAGIDEVQFIEPYLKSKALALHDDSITLPREGWEPPSLARRLGRPGPQRVCFRPYVGAAPRLFRRAFLKDGEVKDGMSGRLLPAPEGAFENRLPLREGYRALEAEIAARFAGTG